MTVTVDADRGVANQIAPGDHVDIAANDRRRGRRRHVRVHPQRREGARGGREHRGAARRRPTSGDAVGADRRRRTRACSPSRCSKDAGAAGSINGQQRLAARSTSCSWRPTSLCRRRVPPRPRRAASSRRGVLRHGRRPGRDAAAYDVAVVEPDAEPAHAARGRARRAPRSSRRWRSWSSGSTRRARSWPCSGPASPARSASSTCTG